MQNKIHEAEARLHITSINCMHGVFTFVPYNITKKKLNFYDQITELKRIIFYCMAPSNILLYPNLTMKTGERERYKETEAANYTKRKTKGGKNLKPIKYASL